MTELTLANHDEFTKTDDLVVVAYLNSKDEAPAAAYSTVAENNHGKYLFGVSWDEDVAAVAGVIPPAIVTWRSYDDRRTELQHNDLPSLTSQELEKWLQDLSIPLVDELTTENVELYTKSGRPVAYFLLDLADEKKDAYINLLKPVAKKYKGRINFCWLPSKRAAAGQKLQWPSFVIEEVGSPHKYPLPDGTKPTTKAIVDWVESFLAGNLDPFHEAKSEPVPKTQNESVFYLVGSQFNDIVLDDTKDVFLILCAPRYVLVSRRSPVSDKEKGTCLPAD